MSTSTQPKNSLDSSTKSWLDIGIRAADESKTAFLASWNRGDFVLPAPMRYVLYCDGKFVEHGHDKDQVMQKAQGLGFFLADLAEKNWQVDELFKGKSSGVELPKGNSSSPAHSAAAPAAAAAATAAPVQDTKKDTKDTKENDKANTKQTPSSSGSLLPPTFERKNRGGDYCACDPTWSLEEQHQYAKKVKKLEAADAAEDAADALVYVLAAAPFVRTSLETVFGKFFF